MLRNDILHTFTSWQPYALIVASLLGLYLVQNAYQAGPLAASMPVMDATLPLVSIGRGIGLFGDAVRTTWWGPGGAGLGILLPVLGIIGLHTSPNVRLEDEAEQRGQQDAAQGDAAQGRDTSGDKDEREDPERRAEPEAPAPQDEASRTSWSPR